MDKGLSASRLRALVWAGMLSPLLRLAPGALLPRAGGAAWLSPLLAAPGIAGLGWFLSRLPRPRAGTGELLCRALGEKAGRAALTALTLWLCFAGGYTLRAGADRFVSAVYPESRVELFMAVMLAIALPAALGELKALGRCARIAAPALAAAMALVAALCLPGTDFGSLEAPTAQALRRGAAGALPLLGGLGHMAVFAALAEGEEGRKGVFLPAGLALTALGLNLTVMTVGFFGPALGERMDYPFFVLLRNLRLSGGGERVEALVAALWVVSDYLLLGAILHIASRCLTRALRGPGAARPAWTVWVCALALGLLGWLCVGRAFSLSVYARRIMPLCGGILAYGALPAVWIIGKLRKKI